MREIMVLLSDDVKCNLVGMPQADAIDLIVFCLGNPKPCPVPEVTHPGDPEPKISAPGGDMQTDFRDARCTGGRRAGGVKDMRPLWCEDSVAFLRVWQGLSSGVVNGRLPFLDAAPHSL
ncbi:MAG: hypothetical protein HYU36_17640 [Planctomycetes bacterium]|nr:hypothetical protein [Planctomycetota bacterium]